MVTQKDIANKLGVSISLVSRVLSGKARDIGIAEETIKLIEDTARLANYVPNSAALNLKGVKTRTLGVVTYDFEDPYLGFILAQLQKIAHEQNYSLILTGAYRRESEHLDITPFIKHNIEGLIIVGSDRKKSWYSPLESKNIPTVQLGFTEEKKGSVLSLDAEKSVSLAVEHIKQEKLNNVALLFNSSLSHEIYSKAYLKVLKKSGFKIAGKNICTCDSEPGQIRSELIRLTEDKPEVLICGDDLLAVSVIRELHNLGIRVPQDIKVIGFDNIPIAEQFIPSITTIAPPLEEMIMKAFDVASSHKTSRNHHLFTPEMKIRESC